MKNLKGVLPGKDVEELVTGDTIREPFAYCEVPMEENIVGEIFPICSLTGGGDAV
jgi:hypothetical protein